MRSWPDYALRRPYRVLICAAALTLAAVPGLFRLELRTDGHALVPARAPEVRTDAAVRARFDARDPIAIVLHGAHPGDLFAPAALRWIAETTTAVAEVEGVDPGHLFSLATEKGFRLRPGSFRFRPLLEPLPQTAAEAAQLRQDLERIETYQGTLVADDGRGGAILVGTPPDGDRIAFFRRLVRLVEARPLPGYEVDVLGAPVAETLLGLHTLSDLGVPRAFLGETVGAAASDGDGGDSGARLGMVPAALLVMAAVLWLAFRRALPVLVTLAVVGGCQVVVFGAMGWLGVPLYLTTAVTPVILTALGVADAIHLFLRFQERHRRTPAEPSAELAAETFDELTAPVVQTSVTTALGLLSFAVSPLGPVRAFGLFTAFGVVLLMLGALTVIPAAMSLAPTRRLASGPTAAAQAGWRRTAWQKIDWTARLSRLVRRRRTLVLTAAALVALTAVDGVRRVEVHDSWLDGFSPQSALAQATRRFEERFLGSHRLLVAVAADGWRAQGEVRGAAVDFHQVTLPATAGLPRDAERLVNGWVRLAQRPGEGDAPSRDWTSWIESARDVDGGLVVTLPRRSGSPKFWLSPAPEEVLDFTAWSEPFTDPQLIRRVAALEGLLAAQPGVGGVLGPARYLETTAFMMAPDDPASRRLPETPDRARVLWRNYGAVRGEDRIRQIVTPELDQGLIAVYLRDSNYTDTARLMATVRDYEERELRPHGLRLDFAGDVAVSQALIDAVVHTQVASLLLSLAGIFAVAAALARSWRWGALCVAPSALAVWLDFALMGWLGIPLGVATSMFAGMTLGVGVDYAIHLLARHRRARAAGLDAAGAVADALRATGPAIAVNALAVGLGFGVLLLSQVPGNVRLGGLLVLSVAGCLAATLLLVPAWLSRERERTEPL